ncbi:MAG: ornithine carbamoyltransferase [Endomicrobiaceae bacterium]|nr:ornithine carbamoyltransferase [Endomicrobiaceae bacterium]MDD3053843.1 ornithine carbamoyltransferase [Endomicrobiaceae bacterium]MDD3922919.1 ornithine carbamoyltransferase [Endomicrobiaceae bacterium]MDD5102061.1 ornithine carbamoyltransferase [Endomicrobiaceae bacterium]
MKKNKKDLLSIYDLTPDLIWTLITNAIKLKKSKKSSSKLSGKTLGLIFEKPSTRTMVSFATAMTQEGGTPLILDSQKLQTNRGESIYDTSKVLSRYLDAIVIRAFKHEHVEEFANASSIPVINGLTDLEHPCQILADLMTIVEKYKIKSVKQLSKLKIAFVGDANNVANSWLAVSAVLGLNFLLLGSKKYPPTKEFLNKALDIAKKTNAKIIVSDDINNIINADVIYTDVWTSMGEESQSKARHKAFLPYQVNDELLKKANKNCIVLHCLPAVRGEEITASVMSKQENNIFDQAENRLHIQKSIIVYLLNK